MNVQVIADPSGRLLWASPALPGAVHDVRAARENGIVNALGKGSLDPQEGAAPALADDLRRQIDDVQTRLHQAETHLEHPRNHPQDRHRPRPSAPRIPARRLQ